MEWLVGERRLQMRRNIVTERKRHGCLTVFLILVIVGNVIAVMSYLFSSRDIRQVAPNVYGVSLPAWYPIVGLVCAMSSIVFAIAVFRWKKWGFYGYCMTTFIGLVVNLAVGFDMLPSVLGLFGVFILYGLLHIGKERKAWTKLE